METKVDGDKRFLAVKTWGQRHDRPVGFNLTGTLVPGSMQGNKRRLNHCN